MEYFWSIVRLPRKVMLGRLMGWWKVVHVLEG